MSTSKRTSSKPPIPKGFWTIWTTVALDLIGFGIVVPILAVYAERFGASGLTIGLLFASFSAAQFLCAPLLGRLSDRIGRKPVIVISLLGTAVGSFITGAAGVLWVLFAGRIIDGASGASLSVAQAAVGDLAPPQERPRLMGLLGAAFGVGFVIGPAIGGLATLGGPHVPFYVAGVLALANALVAIVRLPETRSAATDATPSQPMRRGRHAATPALRQLATIGFITTVAFTAFEATFSLLGRHRFGFGERGSAFVFLGIGLLLVVIQGALYGRLAKRFGVNALYVGGVVLLVAGLAATSVSTVWPLLIAAVVLLSVGQGVASPSISSLVSEVAPPERRGEAMGFQQSAYAVGRIVGPPTAGWMFDHVGVWSPYAVAAGLCAVAVVLLLVWGLHRHRVSTPSKSHG
ncbi:MAG: MFS transporter [Actinobacteria bacterium]|nr:MFS transporter [Actinomycetota bacterium]